MNTLAHCLWVMLGTLELANARPAFIENRSTITNPDPANWPGFPAGVALNGDYALIGAERLDYTDPAVTKVHQTAFLYRRSGRGWELVRQLAATVTDVNGPRHLTNVAMSATVAVVSTTPLTIYELGDTGWTRARSSVPPSALANDDPDLQIDNGRIISGEYDCGANAGIVEKAADGVWRRVATLQGLPRECNAERISAPADISNGWAVVHQGVTTAFPANEEAAWIYRLQGSQWMRLGVAAVPVEQRLWSLFTPVAIRNSEVFLGAGPVSGISRFTLVGREFELAERIRPVDGSMFGNETAQLENSGDLLLQKTSLWDIGTPSAVVNVYQRQDDGTHEHVAALFKRGDPEWPGPVYEHPGNGLAIYGRTVLATGFGVVYHFELPATISAPEPAQETFNLGAAPNWSTSAGSGFRTIRGDRSRVLRQTELAIDTRAIYRPADWTNQAIEVDVNASQFADSSSAISLITRWQDPQNYYEFVIGPARFELRRMAGGALTTLYSQPGTRFIQPGQNRRLRLQSIGAKHYVYLDGRQHLQITSTGGPTHGRAGLGTYRAAADFDNVLITPSPFMTIYRNDFDVEEPVPWKVDGDGNWFIDSSDSIGVRLVQYSNTAETRVTIGTPAAEQRVEGQGRLMQFDPVPVGQKQCFGVVARYIDEGNHYELALCNTNWLVLSRRLNGVSTVLGTFAVNLVPEEYYLIRLDAVGDELRAYLNNRLLFERTDASHPIGNFGLATFHAHVEFGAMGSYQP